MPVYCFEEEAFLPQFTGRILWPALDCWQYPKLRRWDKLGPAFLGFVSQGLSTPHACVYSAKTALRIVREDILARSWIDSADLAEAYEYVTDYFVGVWMGNHTPYLWTESFAFDEILK